MSYGLAVGPTNSTLAISSGRTHSERSTRTHNKPPWLIGQRSATSGEMPPRDPRLCDIRAVPQHPTTSSSGVGRSGDSTDRRRTALCIQNKRQHRDIFSLLSIDVHNLPYVNAGEAQATRWHAVQPTRGPRSIQEAGGSPVTRHMQHHAPTHMGRARR